jgi:archaellum component FlaC
MPAKKKTPKTESLTDLAKLINEFRGEINSRFDSVEKKVDGQDKNLNEFRGEVNTKLDAHAVDIHDLKEDVMGALDGVKLSLDKLAPLETIPERTVTLEREVAVLKTAVKNISTTK